MSIARLQDEVAAAEHELATSRSALDARQIALRREVRDVWVPRALVAGGAATGFWLERRLQPARGADRPTTQRSDDDGGDDDGNDRDAARRPSVAGLSVWLAMAESTLRLVNQLRPLLAAHAQSSNEASDAAGQSAARSPGESDDSGQAAATGRHADVDAWH